MAWAQLSHHKPKHQASLAISISSNEAEFHTGGTNAGTASEPDIYSEMNNVSMVSPAPSSPLPLLESPKYLTIDLEDDNEDCCFSSRVDELVGDVIEVSDDD